MTSNNVEKYILTGKNKDPNIWEYYKKHVASFWTVEECDLSRDLESFDTLNDDEQAFIKLVLAFFVSADGLVAENCLIRFYKDAERSDVRCFYAFQNMIEHIHNEMYSELIECFISDDAEKERLFSSIAQNELIRKKAEWMNTWMNSDRSLAERLVAFACVEGIFFSGAFASIFYLRKRGKCPGLCFANELIARDEGLHRDFACNLFRREGYAMTDGIVGIVRSAVELEHEFVRSILRVALIGMNETSMNQYIEFVADSLMVALGGKKLYSVANPFAWMEIISTEKKTNFFEHRVAEYQKAGVLHGLEKKFEIGEDF